MYTIQKTLEQVLTRVQNVVLLRVQTINKTYMKKSLLTRVRDKRRLKKW